MTVWSIADLHLSFGVPNKKMDIFGPRWEDHAKKIEENWLKLVSKEDLVLIPGDISWALRLDEVKPDLEWIDRLPGTKVMIRGNHDYWWGSLKQIATVLPASIHLVQNSVFNWNGISVAGARLWDTPAFSFAQYIEMAEEKKEKAKDKPPPDLDEMQKVWDREVIRLELSLKALDLNAKQKIVMTHYPPIGSEMEDSQIHLLLKKFKVDICVFGHLHNIRGNIPLFGEKEGIKYYLTACDYLNFSPLKILEN